MLHEKFTEAVRSLPYPTEAERKNNPQEWQNQRQKYNIEISEITLGFRLALEEAHGLKDHPKAGLLWNMAWDEGHSAGYYEVEIWYAKLAELIK